MKSLNEVLWNEERIYENNSCESNSCESCESCYKHGCECFMCNNWWEE